MAEGPRRPLSQLGIRPAQLNIPTILPSLFGRPDELPVIYERCLQTHLSASAFFLSFSEVFDLTALIQRTSRCVRRRGISTRPSVSLSFVFRTCSTRSEASPQKRSTTRQPHNCVTINRLSVVYMVNFY